MDVLRGIHTIEEKTGNQIMMIPYHKYYYWLKTSAFRGKIE